MRRVVTHDTILARSNKNKQAVKIRTLLAIVPSAYFVKAKQLMLEKGYCVSDGRD